jgi:excinuclease ABC subunit A
MEPIRLRGARQNNLRGIDLDIQPGKLLVVTGPSGAGKSSLVLDTLFAEGQRRYVESFSPYARQFLDRNQRPLVRELVSVPPAIAVDRTAPARSGRSTVATRTEIADYLKLLYARAAELHCDDCGAPVQWDNAETVAQRLLAGWPDRRAVVWLPHRCGKSVEELLAAREALLPFGLTRVLTAQGLLDLEELRPSDLPEAAGEGELRVVVDRLRLATADQARLTDSLEQAMRFGRGEVGVDVEGQGTALRAAGGRRCSRCGRAYSEPSPGLFSANNPLGACPECSGFGRTIELDPHKVIDNPALSLGDQAIVPFRGKTRGWERAELAKFCERAGISMDQPWRELSAEEQRLIWEGEGTGRGKWWGLHAWFEYLEARSYKPHVRIQLARYRAYIPCAACSGARFGESTLRYTLGGRNIAEFCGLSTAKALVHLDGLPQRGDVATRVLVKEIRSRLQFLVDVGVGYLSLDRGTRTLSGGEAQRVGLATALGASLSGTLFLIDEPTVGLHPGDVPRLVEAIKKLAAAGNPVVVIDNHEALVAAADEVADLGPGAGAQGGRLVYHGPPAGLARAQSPTARLFAAHPPDRWRTRVEPQRWSTIRGARAHNLQNLDVSLPLGLLTVITGPSGSGKSTLVEEVLVRGLHRQRGEATDEPGPCSALEGFDELPALVVMDQSPLGRTSRGNPGTYVKAWDVLRTRLAATPAAKEAGFKASTFSFNVAGGRCESCAGDGVETVEMQFLPDVQLPCPDCGGRRFRDEVLAVTLAGRTAVELLAMTAQELSQAFPDDRLLQKRLAPLVAVGLDYLQLGQPLNTLSDGEAQRLKLARALGTTPPGAMVVLDEPTVGLHPADVEPLVKVFRQLVDQGCSVVVVEHDMTVAAAADWVIDLGPGAGAEGGRLVAAGPPQEVAAATHSVTAPFLARAWEGKPAIRADVVSEAPVAPRTYHRQGVVAVRGARHHNLKNVSVKIPRDGVTVVTGPSGSGKSTLAFDVVHAEGQRRYLQSLSPFVRQYLRQLPRPVVDSVDGVPPSIALEPRTTVGGGATVATLTEVGHYVRLLYARLGVPHCPDCGLAAQARNPDEIEQAALTSLSKTPGSVLVRLVHHRKGTHREVFARASSLGAPRVRVDGNFYPATEGPRLDRYAEHDLDVELARVDGVVSAGDRAAVVEAVHQGLRLGRGTIRVLTEFGEQVLSTQRSCPGCGSGFPPVDPTIFVPQTRHGACPSCEGRGWQHGLDEDATFAPDLPLGEGGLRPLLVPRFRVRWQRRLRRLTSIPLSLSWRELNASQRRGLLQGRGKWPGLLPALLPLAEQGNDEVTAMIVKTSCTECGGSRLAPLGRHIRLGGDEGNQEGLTFPQFGSLSIGRARQWVEEELRFDGRQQLIGEELRRQVLARLTFLEATGVGYLTLNRPADTLSGGETQRVRLAGQLGSGLSGVCYVLDEPTIGLHPRDTGRLVDILQRLAGLGSTVLVVEHDEQTIRMADHVIDLGPSGGHGGGQVLAQGTPDEVVAQEQSPTGQALQPGGHLPPAPRRSLDHDQWLVVKAPRARNLKGDDAAIPLGRLVAVTGVSGSGKSTLVRQVLWRALKRHLGQVAPEPGAHQGLDGADQVGRTVEVDQSPIGRTPRSVPATYVGIWNDIRKLLAQTPEARLRGYGPERFSFNVAGGRCEACGGQGEVKVEMSFLPLVRARCEVCGGSRFEDSTRQVTYRGLSVDRLLALTAEEASKVFEPFPRIASPLSLLCDLGLGYLTLGQPCNTLSGGEAQRLKLCAELKGRPAAPTLYVLDEPTTGLHLHDVNRLLHVLQRLVDRGHTVVVIEHHPHVYWAADYLLDLGPEGGDQGGSIIAQGPPEEVMTNDQSHTARAMREWLDAARPPVSQSRTSPLAAKN